MKKDFVELCKYNIKDYSSAVNEARAIPDAATGLKPIHRKILYEMWADKILSTGKFKKCAYMVGQLISRFTPHGDAATYDALVRLSQPWVQRYPLLDFHGNNGSAIGDSQAAMRYTEAKLSPIAEKGFLATLGKNCVDWEMNFSNEEKEPSSLPAIFPGLFCLPNQGMGYACSCNFLTFNLQEITEYLLAYIQGKKIPVPAYDLAGGGVFINPQVMSTIAHTGKGNVIIEAKSAVQNKKIVFSEFPFGTTLDKIYDSIQTLYEKGELLDVSEFRNDSENGKLLLTVECKNAKSTENVLNFLLDKTPLRMSYAINQVALTNGEPKLLTLEDMCEIYVSHNLSCIKREYQFDLDKTLDRIEILEGLAKALGDIDGLIKLIKNSESAVKAREKILSYGFTERQADAILTMKLSRLAHLEVDSVLQELAEKKSLAANLREIVESEDRQKEILISRLSSLAKEFGGPRRTRVIQKEIVKPTSGAKQKDEPQDVVVCMDENAYVKVVPINKYHESSSNIREEKSRTDKMILLFSNRGHCFRLRLDTFKTCLNSDKGTALGPILSLEDGERIVDMTANPQCPHLFIATKRGRVKVMGVEEFAGTTQNKRGMPLIRLSEDDEVVWCGCTDNNNFVEMKSRGQDSRKAIFRLSDINLSKKSSSGRVGMKLPQDENVYSVRLLEEVDGRCVANLGTRGSKI